MQLWSHLKWKTSHHDKQQNGCIFLVAIVDKVVFEGFRKSKRVFGSLVPIHFIQPWRKGLCSSSVYCQKTLIPSIIQLYSNMIPTFPQNKSDFVVTRHDVVIFFLFSNKRVFQKWDDNFSLPKSGAILIWLNCQTIMTFALKKKCNLIFAQL